MSTNSITTDSFFKELESRMQADILKAEEQARAKVIEHYRKIMSGNITKDKNTKHRISSDEVSRHKMIVLDTMRAASDSDNKNLSLKEIAELCQNIDKKHVARALKLLTAEGLLFRDGDRRFAKYSIIN